MNKLATHFASRWILVGAVVTALSVGLGAFGAHGLEATIEDRVQDVDRNIENWETASRYQMYHGLGIILVGMLSQGSRGNRCILVAGWLFVVGIVLFSGMLFVLAITDLKILGAIVPLGGLAMILGWLSMACGALSNNRQVSKTENVGGSTDV